MSLDAAEAEKLRGENAYLKLRNAQLQSDMVSVSADCDRLRQELERLHGRRAAAAPPTPLGGGQ